MIFDFTAYSDQPIMDGNEIIATGKLGITIRLTANIITKKNELNLTELFQLGVYAKQDDLSGTLSMEVIGISSPEVLALIPVVSELNVTSVQGALQSLAAIKAKIHDANTRLHPQILAIRPQIDTKTIQEILTIYKSNPKSVQDIKINYNQQQQIQQQIQQQQQQQIQLQRY
jgi:hypothetical protein